MNWNEQPMEYFNLCVKLGKKFCAKQYYFNTNCYNNVYKQNKIIKINNKHSLSDECWWLKKNTE